MNQILRWVFLIFLHVILPLVYLWSDTSLIVELLQKDEWWEIVFSPNKSETLIITRIYAYWMIGVYTIPGILRKCKYKYEFDQEMIFIIIFHRTEALNWIITACMGETSCREFSFWIIFRQGVKNTSILYSLRRIIIPIFSIFFPISVVIWNIGHAIVGPRHFDK